MDFTELTSEESDAIRKNFESVAEKDLQDGKYIFIFRFFKIFFKEL
jgi:hypothetical protein